jgi:hypothetical protein
MGGVFISYRRADSQGTTGRLADRLQQILGRDAPLFYDIDSIRPGEDFQQVIEETLAQCDVTLVMIGPQWTTLADANGRRRLDDPADLVRLEVEESLKSSSTTVIPVLVDGASMPGPNELPESIRSLSSVHAAELTPRGFANDTDVLAQRIRGQLNFERPTSVLLSAASVLVLFVAVALVLALGGLGEPSLDAPVGTGDVRIDGVNATSDADAIDIDLGEPVPISVDGVAGAAEAQLRFSVASIPLGSTEWGPVEGGTALVAADVTEFTTSGVVTAEVRVRDADEVIVATRAFEAAVQNPWYRTAMGLATVLLALAGFAYLESGLRSMRSGQPSVTGYVSCASGGVMLAAGLVFGNAVFRSVHVGLSTLVLTACAVAVAALILAYLVVTAARPRQFARTR